MGHAMERLLIRCEGEAYRKRYAYVINILQTRPEVCLEIFPAGSKIRVVSPAGQLKVVSGKPTTFLPDHSVPVEGETTQFLDVIEARIERAIIRQGWQELSQPIAKEDGRKLAGARRRLAAADKREAEDSIRFTQLRSLWDLGAVQVSFADIVTFAEKRGWRKSGEALDDVADWLETWVSQGRLVEIGGEGQEIWAFKLGKEK